MVKVEKETDIQIPRNFAVISLFEAGICQTPDELYSALEYRKSWLCDVFAYEELTLLSCLVRQYYPSNFYRNTTYPSSPLQLPAKDTFYALQIADPLTITPTNDHLPNTVQNAVPSTCIPCFWGVNGLNGYCICNNVSELIGTLADPAFLVFPWAKCFVSANQAYFWARGQYTFRFFQRYDVTQESFKLPISTNPLEAPFFIDPCFEEREAHLKASSNSLLNELHIMGF